jgi:hypothetical protein
MPSGRMLLACVLGAICALLPDHGHAGRLAAGEPLLDRGETPAVWRTPSHDGANCLYLLLALSGRNVDYHDVTAAVEASGRGSNLAGLRDAARRLGLETSVYQWRPGQLIHAPSPVIAYLDSYNGEGGYFTLVFEATERDYCLVNGAKVTVEDLRTEDFCHVWSGYVLAPTQPHRWKAERLSYGISIIVLAGYAWFRLRGVLAVPGAGARSRVT